MHLGCKLGTFREDLERVMGTGQHDVEDPLDERQRHILLEQVTHRVDEDQSRQLPPQRYRQSIVV